MECKKSQLLFFPSLGCFLKCHAEGPTALCIYCVERENGMDILTVNKLSLKLPITTVNGRWLLAATRQILPRCIATAVLQRSAAATRRSGTGDGDGDLFWQLSYLFWCPSVPVKCSPAARLRPRTFVFSRQ